VGQAGVFRVVKYERGNLPQASRMNHKRSPNGSNNLYPVLAQQSPQPRAMEHKFKRQSGTSRRRLAQTMVVEARFLQERQCQILISRQDQDEMATPPPLGNGIFEKMEMRRVCDVNGDP